MQLVTLVALVGCLGGTPEPGTPDPGTPATPATPDAATEEAPAQPRPKLAVGASAPTTPAAGSTPAPGEPEAPITDQMCSDLEDGGEIVGPGCLTGTLSCGSEVIGHTLGGGADYDTRFYERHHCTPGTTNHDSGDERVYLLTIPPGDQTATVVLDTPCADLDLAAMRVADASSCPGPSTSVRQCEMWPKKGTKREKVVLSSKDGASWFVVVEGKDDAEGAFALTVTCEDHL